MPAVSIIMPSFKVEKFIDKAMKSVLTQNFTDWELIIVDDGSPDNTKDVASSFANQDERIKVVSKPNGGLSDARNFGLSLATGDYIHFFDPDDYLDGEFYSHLISQAKDNNADVVIAGYKLNFIDKNGEDHISTRNCPSSFCQSLYLNQSSPIKYVGYAWNKLFKREFLLKNNLYYEVGLSRIEDAEFMSRLIDFKPKIAFYRQCNYVYVQHPTTTLSKGFDAYIISLVKRRLDIDMKLIQFFSNYTVEKKNLENHLKTYSVISTINRLYDSSECKMKVARHKYLEEIRTLFPSKIIYYKENILRQIFYNMSFWGLKHKKFALIDLLQRSRKFI